MECNYFAFVGTNSVRGSRGIYSIKIDAKSLKPVIASARQFYNSGSVALSQNDRYLYAACEGMTFHGYADGGVSAFEISDKGELTEIGSQRSFGQRTCCVTLGIDDRELFACNFYTGTFTAYELNDQGKPEKVLYTIASPKIPGAWLALHCVKAIDMNYVGVISLTECALVVYEAKTGRRVYSYQFPDHPFCRYIETIKRYVYALMQDTGDIYIFKNELNKRNKLELIQKISLQDVSYKGDFGATTLHASPDGRLLIAATRVTNTLTVFRVHDDGTLERSDIVELPGAVPRDFNISRDGRIVVTACQKSDEICVHRIDYENGTLDFTEGCKVSVPSPATVSVSDCRF